MTRLKLHVPSLSINCVPSILLSPPFDFVVELGQFQPITMQLNFRASLVNNVPFSLVFVSSFKGSQLCRALHMRINSEEASHVIECREQKLSGNCYERETLDKQIQLESCSDSEESLDDKDDKEIQRRRKIGLANKGRVPWNKGRKHSAETCKRIKQRTKEALRDPKVRKKMSECPRALSNQTKARIRSSLRRLWGERLKWKRSRDKFFLLWAESIAIAAKKGGFDQQELDWDSHDKLKTEIALQQLKCAADKAKAKEMARIRAERVAQAKAERMARLAQKRKEQDQRAKVSGEVKKKTHKKSKEEEQELAAAQDLKLKERLIKIHGKRSINGQVTSQDHRGWEKLDVEFIKKEQRRKEVSLADQIRAVKNKKAEFLAMETPTTSSSIYTSSKRSVG